MFGGKEGTPYQQRGAGLHVLQSDAQPPPAHFRISSATRLSGASVLSAYKCSSYGTGFEQVLRSSGR